MAGDGNIAAFKVTALEIQNVNDLSNYQCVHLGNSIQQVKEMQVILGEERILGHYHALFGRLVTIVAYNKK